MKFYKIYMSIVLLFAFFVCNYNFDVVNASPVLQEKQVSSVSNCDVSPVAVVNSPEKYLNKNISFDAEFVAFTSLGLDYKPAYRDASKYIGVLIRRNDVTTHVIPLSEMKMFLSREIAEKLVDIESGAKVRISGKVFSTALGDPWVDVIEFKVLDNNDKNVDKK